MASERPMHLAWRNLSEQPLRLLASASGVAFAIVLILMQLGFRNALLESMSALIDRLDGEVVIVGRGLYTLVVPQSFPGQRLEQARAFTDVASATPLYLEPRRSRWRNPDSGRLRRIRLVGFRPEDSPIRVSGLEAQRDLLLRPGTAVADRFSKVDQYGTLEEGVQSELSGRRLRIVGQVELGRDFQNDGTLFVGEQTFLDIFPARRGTDESSQRVDLALIRTRPGANPAALAALLEAELPDDVRVLTRTDLVSREQHFWDKVAPLGAVFYIGVVMGFVVGTAICYQILYSDLSERLAEFATLRAMGYRDSWLVRVVLSQAAILGTIGFAVGVCVSLLLYDLVHEATGLPMTLHLWLALIVFGLSQAMCATGALLAARRLFRADPAGLFR